MFLDDQMLPQSVHLLVLEVEGREALVFMALQQPPVAFMEDFQGFMLVLEVMEVTHPIMEVMVVMLAHIVMAVHLHYLHMEALHLVMVA